MGGIELGMFDLYMHHTLTSVQYNIARCVTLRAFYLRMSNYYFTTTDTIFNITFEEKQDFGRHSTKVHQLLLTFVCRSKCLAESFQRGGSLCRVRCSFGYSEVEAQLRVEVVLRPGAHDVGVWVSARQSQIRR